MFFGMVIGYVIGRRKAIMAMMKKGEMMQKIKKAAAGAGEDDKDANEEEESPEDAAKELLEQFLSRDSAPTMDNHPETEINKIFLFHIRKKQEEVKQQKIIDTLLDAQNFEEGYLEGLSLTARQKLGQKLLSEQTGPVQVASSVGSVLNWRPRNWGTNRNSTEILVSAGASMAPGTKATDSLDAAEKAIAELKDKKKQIDKHLEVHLQIDANFESTKGMKRSADGKRLKDAYTVANETLATPFMPMHEVLNFEERQTFAKRGRARVAPPQDTRGPTGGGDGRRASAMGGGGGGLRRASANPAAEDEGGEKAADPEVEV